MKPSRGIVLFSFWEKLGILSAFLLYLFFCREFVSGHITLNVDSAAHYSYAKYYINNLLNGVIPIWDPFVFWGSPFVPIVSGGLLNPVIYLMGAGVLLGLDYYQAYIVFILTYYFIGSLGFYLLSRRFLGDPWYAFLAYAGMLFSGMGLMVFNQIYILLIFVPAVWFFFFLLRFAAHFRKGDFLGLIFSLMMIAVSYYPFYFLTVFILLVLFYALFNWERSKSQLGLFRDFLVREKAVAVFCFVALLVSSAPLIMFKLRDQAGEIITPVRHFCHPPQQVEGCFKGAAMTFPEVGYAGTLAWRGTLRNLFSSLDKWPYSSDICFYIPILFLLIICTSMFVPLDRGRKTLLWTGFVTFLVSLGAVTPLHEFLYRHVFYFKYFRNFFFFIAFLMPMAVLFATAQLKAMLEFKGAGRLSRRMATATVVCLHALFLVFMNSQGENLATSWLTVGISLLFFLCCFAAAVPRLNPRLFLILLTLILLQPGEFFFRYQVNAADVHCRFPSGHKVPGFSFARPENSRNGCPIFGQRDFDFESNMSLSDSDGHIRSIPDSISRWAYYLTLNMREQHVLDFIRNKLYLYGQVVYYNQPDQAVLAQVEAMMTGKKGAAYAFDENLPPGAITQDPLDREKPEVSVINAPTEQFRVLDFNVNGASFGYDHTKPKFLVYTDNFTSSWRAYIDGKPQRVFRSNIAFKGVWLPAGSHQLRFAYEPPGGQWIYWFCAGFFIVFLAATLLMLAGENRDSFYLRGRG